VHPIPTICRNSDLTTRPPASRWADRCRTVKIELTSGSYRYSQRCRGKTRNDVSECRSTYHYALAEESRLWRAQFGEWVGDGVGQHERRGDDLLRALAMLPFSPEWPHEPQQGVGAEIEALAGTNPNFAAWEQNEPYTIALLIKGRSGGTGTKHLYRSGSSSTGDHILFLTSGTTPNLRHQASGGGTVTITSSVAIVNDTTWSTIVGTWRPGRLELYVDGFSRASSTAAGTNTSALFGIYRWGWGFSTSQDFNGDIALIACFASSWTPAMVRRWHADPFGFLRPWGEVPALMASAPPATPPSTGTGVVTFLMG
jgi:Concanavalin A-like lectin/glucanases superfamily